MTENM